MAEILVRTNGFRDGYSSLNGVRRINISRTAFLRATLTVGFQRFSDFAGAGMRQWCHRIGCGLSAMAYLEKDGRDLVISESRNLLDMSEKGAQSYWQGMVFAKLVTEEILGVPWLANVDDMKTKGLLHTSLATKQRGDLVGRCRQNHWHVVEAKARSGPFSADLVDEAKWQASCISSIAGQAPATSSACITSLWTNPIEVILDDPPGEDKIAWQFDDDEFWKYYYGNIVEFILKYKTRLLVPEQYEGYTFASLVPALGVFPNGSRSRFPNTRALIGLPDEIIENPRFAARLLKSDLPDPKRQMGSDGIVLIGNFGDWDPYVS